LTSRQRETKQKENNDPTKGNPTRLHQTILLGKKSYIYIEPVRAMDSSEVLGEPSASASGSLRMTTP